MLWIDPVSTQLLCTVCLRAGGYGEAFPFAFTGDNAPTVLHTCLLLFVRA
jgi:hypothetical protein